MFESSQSHESAWIKPLRQALVALLAFFLAAVTPAAGQDRFEFCIAFGTQCG
ncbi:MAG: hypothetical protein V1790_15640 [Planctomycetota bacterium]